MKIIRQSSIFFTLAACLYLLFGMVQADEEKQIGEETPKILVLKVSGGIVPAITDYIQKGLDRANEINAELIVLQLDTPGGLVSTTRDINKAILGSEIPVATYVSPSGAHAGSAGTYILYASHIAAMAPGTNVGAATPVQMGAPESDPRPKNSDKDGSNKESDEKSTEHDGAGSDNKSKTAMQKKIENDAAAQIRSLAELRGRNVEWGELAVREAASITADEALDKNVIEYVSDNVHELLKQVHGRTVKTVLSEKTMNTEGAIIEHLEQDWRIRLLVVLTDPNIVYFLVLLGLYGLIYEFMNPGFVLPGVIGAICLIVALYASQALPINYAGAALILLGIGFMVAEAFAPSFGILGIGGTVAFVLGSIILLDDDGYAISLPMILSNAAVSAVLFIWVAGMAIKIRKKPVVSGVDNMIGSVAIAVGDFQGKGKVKLLGEVWHAQSSVPISDKQEVKVIAVDGLLLSVEPGNQE